MRWILFILALMAAGPVGASIYKKALDVKKDQYLTHGVVVGGQAGAGFTLLNVRRQNSPKLSLERVILDIGNREGAPLAHKLGYFHVSIEKNPSRVVIDLMQVGQSKITEMALAKLFRRSPFVKKAELTMEAEDGSAKLVLNTKGPIAAEIFEMPSLKKPGRIVIDLKKASL